MDVHINFRNIWGDDALDMPVDATTRDTPTDGSTRQISAFAITCIVFATRPPKHKHFRTHIFSHTPTYTFSCTPTLAQNLSHARALLCTYCTHLNVRMCVPLHVPHTRKSRS